MTKKKTTKAKKVEVLAINYHAEPTEVFRLTSAKDAARAFSVMHQVPEAIKSLALATLTQAQWKKAVEIGKQHA